MKTIPLTQGYVALVDDADYEELSRYKWQAMVKPHTVYAFRSHYVDGRTKGPIRMHRQIMGATKGQQVDHIDGDGLNNTRANLRLCTNQQNSRNRAKSNDPNLTSQYKGVSLMRGRPRKNPWRARIKVNGKHLPVGCFASQEEAALAYDKKCLELFGDFGKLNFPERITSSEPASA